jgi:dTDP-4-amino-4,6-dideoxygalactose transaminase
MTSSTKDVPFKIPLFDLDIGEEETQAVQEVLSSKWLTMGDVTRQFERAFAHFLGVPYCFAVCNGTAALHLAVQALGIGPGDEVICPSLTFVATANAVHYAGATPVFADIRGKHDLNISPQSIEAEITERTKAIIAVHYAGFPCPMEEISEIGSTYGLKIIEDAAHAPGAEFFSRDSHGNINKAQKAGSIGDVGCFSFFSNKNLSTGEGGMVATRDERIAEKVKAIRSHGMTSMTLDRHRGHSFSYDVIELGYNYRIDEMRSAMGIVQLGRLVENNARRKKLYNLYEDELKGVDGLAIPFEASPHHSAYHIFPTLLPEQADRTTFMETLRANGIQTSIHYPPIHQFTFYKQAKNSNTEQLKWTEYAGAHEVTLPLYPSLKDEDVNYIVSCVKDALNASQSQGICFNAH